MTAIDWASAVVCAPRCWTCQTELPAGQDEGYCSDVCARTYPVMRWTCTCGRFIAEQDVCCRDYRDPGAYYGISTEGHWHCSRCGFRQGEPRLTEVGTAVASA